MPLLMPAWWCLLLLMPLSNITLTPLLPRAAMMLLSDCVFDDAADACCFRWLFRCWCFSSDWFSCWCLLLFSPMLMMLMPPLSAADIFADWLLPCRFQYFERAFTPLPLFSLSLYASWYADVIIFADVVSRLLITVTALLPPSFRRLMLADDTRQRWWLLRVAARAAAARRRWYSGDVLPRFWFCCRHTTMIFRFFDFLMRAIWCFTLAALRARFHWFSPPLRCRYIHFRR